MRVAPEAAEGAVAGEGESDDDEAEEQSGFARNDQGSNGERRPRRRGRRGGRRRRGGGPEDGLAGSIADELGPTSVPEAADAVADFDGGSPEPVASLVQPEPVSQPAELQPADHARPEPVGASSPEETAQEAERAARRRSTVREKVSFLTSTQPDAPTPVTHREPEPAPGAAPAEPAPATAGEDQPRKAGWWSRRFGGE